MCCSGTNHFNGKNRNISGMAPVKPERAGKHVTITIDKETYGKLNEIAQRNEMSIPAVIKKMVENYSLAEEDEEDSVE